MKFSIALIASISATIVAAIPSAGLEARAAHRARAHVEPRGYAKDADLLEPYDTYHERYLSIGCRHEHGKPFFDQCCHPLLKGQTEDMLADSCWDNMDCDDDEDGTGASTSVVENYAPSTAPAPAPSTQAAPSTLAPKPSSSAVPKPSTSKAPKPSTTSVPPPAQTSPAGGNEDWNYGGQVTYFTQNGRAGACGTVHSDYDLIAAIDQARWGGDFGVQSAMCGKSATICRIDNESKCVTVTFADVCPSCEGAPVAGSNAANSIDLSVGAFQALGNLGEGTITVRWKFD